MQNLKSFFPGLVLLLFLSAFVGPARPIRVYMIGDSTMCEYAQNRTPLTGWGMPFKYFFDSTVTICNRARGGRSTRTFLEENRWQPIADSLQEGDYVLIQFGHNDEAKEEIYKARYTPVPAYKTNLIRFITETRNKKAIPVLITPVTRMVFDSLGNMQETHAEYSAAVWEIGRAYNTPVIDLDAKSRDLLQHLGPVYSKMLFMQLDTLEHPNYPNGQNDNTHFNEYGARRMAEIVLAEMRNLHLDLVDRIVIPPVKK
jgi:lysophospholipase L1-like esterase